MEENKVKYLKEKQVEKKEEPMKAETEEKKSRLKLIAENYYSKLRNRKIFKVQTKFKKGI